MPASIAVQLLHSLQGLGAGPSLQLSARARMRAADVLPTPRAPVSRKAWWIRPSLMALPRVRVTWPWPAISSKTRGRHLRAMAW